MTAPRPWPGISPREWFINSDTPHRRRILTLDGRLHRPRAAPDLQLCRLRTAERGCRGDAEPAAGRAGDGCGKWHPGRHPLWHSDLRDSGCPAGAEDHRHRRLPRRGHRDLQRLRRRADSPGRHHDGGLHHRPRHLGRRLDDRIRPCPGGIRLRRRVRGLVRGLQPTPRHAGAGERDVGGRRDDLHDHRGQPEQGQHGLSCSTWPSRRR